MYNFKNQKRLWTSELDLSNLAFSGVKRVAGSLENFGWKNNRVFQLKRKPLGAPVFKTNFTKDFKKLKGTLEAFERVAVLYLSLKLQKKWTKNLNLFKKFFFFFKNLGFFRRGSTQQVVSGSKNKSLRVYQSLNDYFFSQNFFNKISRGSRWLSMEEIITHFIFYSEGPVLPVGFSCGGVEAPKGHLGVVVVSRGGNKPERARIRSSILVMAGQITSLVQGVSLGDFVVIVSGSNIVVGEIDR